MKQKTRDHGANLVSHLERSAGPEGALVKQAGCRQVYPDSANFCQSVIGRSWRYRGRGFLVLFSVQVFRTSALKKDARINSPRISRIDTKRAVILNGVRQQSDGVKDLLEWCA